MGKQIRRGEKRQRRQFFFFSSSSPETRLGAGPIQTAYIRGLKVEVFLPVIVFISPTETGPAGQARPPGGDKAHSGFHLGEGREDREGRRSPACPPADRSYPAPRSRPRPRRPVANPESLLPGRTSPGDTGLSATPQLEPGTAARTRSPSRPISSRACAAADSLARSPHA